ncbi:MAG: hypothetical protein NC311_06120 [Muribaculaceae bacterium]|nr:hypothetical protein [Muribaculaceae bacterium]
MEKIIQKVLSDPRIAETITTVLIDILSNMQQSENAVANAPADPTPQANAPKVIDWSSKSNGALRAAYTYRKKRGLTIEPELNEILAARFAGYDTAQQKFTGRGGKRKSKSTAPVTPIEKTQKDINWVSKSNATLRTMYAYRKKRGLIIEPELNTALAARFPGYDAIQQKFTGRGGKRKVKAKKVRIINWAEKTDVILRKAFKHRQNIPNGIDDALNAELARRFPSEYDPATRKFVKQQKSHDVTTKDTQKSAIPTVVRTNAPVTKSQSVASTTTAKPSQLSVTLKPVKQSLDATFYNVYVNEQLILRNHANTELKLLGDGTLLAVHGIVTDNKNLPQRPLYLIYDTNLVPNRWAGRDKIAGYDIYAKYITTTSDGVNVMLSNKCTIILNNEKLKRLAGLARFEIVR